MPATASESKNKKAQAAKDKKAEVVEKKQAQIKDTEVQDPDYVSPRDPALRTAELNSAPHPELWPAPDTAEDAEAKDPDIRVVPAEPSINFEYTIKASGLPPNSGVTFRLDQPGVPETWLTHKSDPLGDAHIVWRTQNAGTVKVEVFTRDAGETGDEITNHSFKVISPERDRRFGEARGAA